MSRVQVGRGIIPRLYHDIYEMEILTNVPVDDQFSSPKQIRWAGNVAGGKLLVANDPASNYYISGRNSDLSFYSKWFISAGNIIYGCDADSSNVYSIIGSAGGIYKHNLNINTKTYFPGIAASPRMIDASGDPLHVYVTSNNATDGHGVRMVTKSSMTVTTVGGNPVQILATGTGNNQFTNPLGVLFVSTGVGTGKLYICEATRICVLDVVTTAGSESLAWSTSHAIAANDLAWDGTNFYVQTATQTIKYDSVFTDGTKVATACVGYSITYIPDQSDGYGATLAIVDSTNSHLERRKCSDLSAINSVGSAGDGSSSLFDPTFTTSVATQITYQFDDGFTYVTPLDTSHALSWNGFAGHSFRSAGPHKCTVKVAGGVELVTGIDVIQDYVLSVTNYKKLIKITSLSSYGTGNTWPIRISDLPSCLYWNVYPYLSGNLLEFNRNLTTVYGGNCANIYGSLSDLPNTSTTIWVYGSINILPTSIAHLIAIHDLRIYSMGWLTADVDTVINSMYTARANYTYATGPSLQIGGTNQSPSGSYTDPLVTPGDGNSNSDWSWDGTKHVPLTGKAKIYYLVNGPDHGTDTFYRWSITYTT